MIVIFKTGPFNACTPLKNDSISKFKDRAPKRIYQKCFLRESLGKVSDF